MILSGCGIGEENETAPTLPVSEDIKQLSVKKTE